MNTDNDEKKKVDEDWKKAAQLDKEQDAAKFEPKPEATDGSAPVDPKAGKPSPQFVGLIESLASQALMFMGAVRDPMGGEPQTDLRQAQAMIDMLTMVEEKTKGNLVAEEAEMVKQVLNEVRTHFIRASSPPPPAPQPPQA